MPYPDCAPAWGSEELPMPTTSDLGDTYLILPPNNLGNFIRPVRRGYIHEECGKRTMLGLSMAQAYAKQPTFCAVTFCVHCERHRPVAEFTWDDGSGELVGS